MGELKHLDSLRAFLGAFFPAEKEALAPWNFFLRLGAGYRAIEELALLRI